MKIITNNQPRPLIYGCELSPKEREEFDYYDAEELDSALFFEYKGHVYDLGNFMRLDREQTEFAGWHGYHADSFFSGILVKLIDDEAVVVGMYLS